MELEEINGSLRNLFLGGLMFQEYETRPIRRGEISWIHYNPTSRELMIIICCLGEEDESSPDTWRRLVDIPLRYQLKIDESYLAMSLSALMQGDLDSLVIPDGEHDNEQNIVIYTSFNPWLDVHLADFNSSTH